MSPEHWSPVCRWAELEVGRGAGALVHGQPMAIFRTSDGSVYAVGNHDPFDRTATLAKGIFGERDGVPFVGSLRHGHVFDLRSGRCLDDTHIAIPAYEVRVVEGVVLVGPRKGPVSGPVSGPVTGRTVAGPP